MWPSIDASRQRQVQSSAITVTADRVTIAIFAVPGGVTVTADLCTESQNQT